MRVIVEFDDEKELASVRGLGAKKILAVELIKPSMASGNEQVYGRVFSLDGLIKNSAQYDYLADLIVADVEKRKLLEPK